MRKQQDSDPSKSIGHLEIGRCAPVRLIISVKRKSAAKSTIGNPQSTISPTSALIRANPQLNLVRFLTQLLASAHTHPPNP
jgi:hypothetical protein